MFRRIFLGAAFTFLWTSQVLGAGCFWVGGTATWDQTNTGGGGAGGIKWASASGGGTACAAVSGPAAGVPGASDTATLDAASGGGTVTLNFGGTVSLTTLTMGAFTGTFDNSVNNNNFTISGNFAGSGTGARTYKLGTATYTLTGAASRWQVVTVTNLTYTATASTISFTGTSGLRGIESSSGTAMSHGNVIFAASTGSGRGHVNNNSGASTLASLTITAPNYIQFPAGATTTITGAFTWTGTRGSEIAIASDAISTTATAAAAANSTAAWASFRDMTFTGSPIANNSFDLGNNSGITINGPATFGSGGGFIGGN